MNVTMIEELVEIMKQDKYNVLFDYICGTIESIATDAAEDYCKDHEIQNDGIEILNSLSDEEIGTFFGAIIKTMLERLKIMDDFEKKEETPPCEETDEKPAYGRFPWGD